MRVTEETKCRVCRGELKEVLNLGSIYPSSFIKGDEKLSEDMKAPLVLAECEDCKLVQLKHTVDLDLMYRQYWYASSLNKSMVSSLQDIVKEIFSRNIMRVGTFVVVDIGCNDGTMLDMYPKHITKVGFDPSLNLKRMEGFKFINDYFTKEAYPYEKKANVITAIAMFYDLPDPHQFVEDVANILHEDGIFVVQFTDLLSMFKACAFDNICHEHLEYYKFADVKFLLETHGLEVIDVSYNDVNGGSIRVTAAHQGRYPISKAVKLAYDNEAFYFSRKSMRDFAECIETTKISVKMFLELVKTLKLTVYLLGASTKGNTFLQICNITSDSVPYAAEVNRDKFGLKTAGSNIYIISEEDAFSDVLKPDFFLVPIWHFKKNILKNERVLEFINNGGELIFPLPEFHVVGLEELKDD